eukprot:7106460-Alexandrium_andersonii.AAC.1
MVRSALALALIECDFLRSGVLNVSHPTVREGVPFDLDLAEDCLKLLNATGLLGPRAGQLE